MKAYLINMHLLIPRSRSFAKVEVKYKGYISQKMAVRGIRVSQTHLVFFSTKVKVIYKYQGNIFSKFGHYGGSGISQRQLVQLKFLSENHINPLPHNAAF